MHDAKGQPLSVGDTVLIPCQVTSVSPGADYCNVTVETLGGRAPDGQKNRYGDINTKQLIRANEGDDTTFRVAKDGDREMLTSV